MRGHRSLGGARGTRRRRRYLDSRGDTSDGPQVRATNANTAIIGAGVPLPRGREPARAEMKRASSAPRGLLNTDPRCRKPRFIMVGAPQRRAQGDSPPGRLAQPPGRRWRGHRRGGRGGDAARRAGPRRARLYGDYEIGVEIVRRRSPSRKIPHREERRRPGDRRRQEGSDRVSNRASTPGGRAANGGPASGPLRVVRSACRTGLGSPGSYAPPTPVAEEQSNGTSHDDRVRSARRGYRSRRGASKSPSPSAWGRRWVTSEHRRGPRVIVGDAQVHVVFGCEAAQPGVRTASLRTTAARHRDSTARRLPPHEAERVSEQPAPRVFNRRHRPRGAAEVVLGDL